MATGPWLRPRIGLIGCLASGALIAMLLSGGGLSPPPQLQPAAPSQLHGLRPPPGWVMDRMTYAAQDLYFDVNSHILRAGERRKLAPSTPALEAILHDFRELAIVVEGHSDDRGLVEYNGRLALERAETVRRTLRSFSFPEDRFRTAMTMPVRIDRLRRLRVTDGVSAIAAADAVLVGASLCRKVETPTESQGDRTAITLVPARRPRIC